jgi:hypothetical protein
MNEPIVEVSVWKLREIADTLRLVSNTLESPKRESCLDRKVMTSWNIVVDILNGHTPSPHESLDYYMKKGQMPKLKEDINGTKESMY